MSSVPGWLISRSSAISAPSGSLLDAAYLVRLSRGVSTREVIVEFADSSSVVSNGYAEEVARRFLRDAEPPQHLRVEASGLISVLVGPREPSLPDARHDHVDLAPGRARNHRRGTSSS